MWLLRNTHQYDAASDQPINFKKLQLLQEIKDLYVTSDQMLNSNRDIFAKEYITRENHTIMQLQTYKNFAHSISQKSIIDTKEHKKHFRKIKHYFLVITSIKTIITVKEKNNRKTKDKGVKWKPTTQIDLQTHMHRSPPKSTPPVPRLPKPG